MEMQGGDAESGEEDEGPFAMGWLSTELLAGVMQRLSMGSKVEVERVDCHLAAVTRTLGWRLHRSLSLHVSLSPSAPLQLSADDLTVELSGSSSDAAAVTRYFVQRARVVEFKVVSQLPDGGEAVSEDGLAGKQAQMRAMATALCSAGVHLRVLSLEGTATELFGSPAPAAALFRRHAATLEQAALGLRHDTAESAELLSVVRACTGLRHFTGHLQSPEQPINSSSYYIYRVEPSSAISALFDGWPPASCALTLASSPGTAVAYWANFPPMPHLQELHLLDVAVGEDDIIPQLQVLRLVNTSVGSHPFFVCAHYIAAFFKRADVNLSLSIEVDVRARASHENWLTCLRRCCAMYGVNDVLIECFDAAVCAEESVALPAAPPPPLPPQFEHNGESVVFRLQRHGENRHLVIALFVLPPPVDDDDDDACRGQITHFSRCPLAV